MAQPPTDPRVAAFLLWEEDRACGPGRFTDYGSRCKCRDLSTRCTDAGRRNPVA